MILQITGVDLLGGGVVPLEEPDIPQLELGQIGVLRVFRQVLLQHPRGLVEISLLDRELRQVQGDGFPHPRLVRKAPHLVQEVLRKIIFPLLVAFHADLDPQVLQGFGSPGEAALRLAHQGFHVGQLSPLGRGHKQAPIGDRSDLRLRRSQPVEDALRLLLPPFIPESFRRVQVEQLPPLFAELTAEARSGQLPDVLIAPLLKVRVHQEYRAVAGGLGLPMFVHEGFQIRRSTAEIPEGDLRLCFVQVGLGRELRIADAPQEHAESPLRLGVAVQAEMSHPSPEIDVIEEAGAAIAPLDLVERGQGFSKTPQPELAHPPPVLGVGHPVGEGVGADELGVGIQSQQIIAGPVVALRFGVQLRLGGGGEEDRECAAESPDEQRDFLHTALNLLRKNQEFNGENRWPKPKRRI